MGFVVNRALSSLHGGSLEIMLTVPLTIGNLTWGQDLVENNECVSEYVVMYRYILLCTGIFCYAQVDFIVYW